MIRTRTVQCVLLSWAFSALLARAFQPDPAMLRHMFEQALAKRRAEYGAADARTAQAARDLGLFLQRSGDAPSARTALAAAVSIDEAAFGKAAPQTLEDVYSLAAVSPPLQAEPLLRRAAESPDAAVGGPALSSLAEIRKNAGDRPGAAAYLLRALDKAEEVDGKDGTIVALILNSLALDVGPKEGVVYLERALKIDRSKLGARDPQTILTEISLARLFLASAQVTDAVAMARDSLTDAEMVWGSKQPNTAAAASVLAHAIQTQGDRREAERLYRLALSIDQAALGSQNSRTRSDARDLALLLRQTGKAAEAAALDRQFNAAPRRP